MKNVTGIFACLFDGSLGQNDIKSDGNPIIFLENAMEISGLELFENPCHIFARERNKTWTNDME